MHLLTSFLVSTAQVIMLTRLFKGDLFFEGQEIGQYSPSLNLTSHLDPILKYFPIKFDYAKGNIQSVTD